MMRGKLIVIEGVDGAGKTTQLEILLKKLNQSGHKAERIKFPRYETFFGKQIRAYLDGEFGSLEQMHSVPTSILYALDRMDAAKMLKKMMKDGTYVLCDRYFISNLAYQGAKIKDLIKRKEFITWLIELEHKHLGIVKEDFIIFLDLPVNISSEAVLKRGEKTDIHEKDISFMRTTREAFLDLCKNSKKCAIVNCMKSQTERKSIEEVAEDVWKIFKEKILK